MGKVLLRRRAVVFFLSSLRRLVQTIFLPVLEVVERRELPLAVPQRWSEYGA